jgi:helix-turn-helix, Psq domain
MPGSHKGHRQGAWDVSTLKLAVHAVNVDKMSEKSAAKRHGIPRETLRRHLKKVANGFGVSRILGRRSILGDDEELVLVNLIMDMKSRLYGLTPVDVRKAVYNFCEKRGIVHQFNREKEIAGERWFKLFMKRHKELSIRVPESTSIQRAIGFNKVKVDLFYKKLQEIIFSTDGFSPIIPPDNIFNADETGFTICHKPHKVLAKKGRRSVGAVTSAEKGKNVTVLCCFIK